MRPAGPEPFYPNRHAAATLRPGGTGVGVARGAGVGARAADTMLRSLDELFVALEGSAFRRRFRLRGRELEYLRRKGLPTVMEHAADFIEKRLAAAEPANDGRQTPTRGHPVFVAQHATATCCRNCLSRNHGIAKGHELTPDELDYVVDVVCRWIERELAGDSRQPTLPLDT